MDFKYYWAKLVTIMFVHGVQNKDLHIDTLVGGKNFKTMILSTTPPKGPSRFSEILNGFFPCNLKDKNAVIIYLPTFFLPGIVYLSQIFSAFLLGMLLRVFKKPRIDMIETSRCQVEGMIAAIISSFIKKPILVNYGDPYWLRYKGIKLKLTRFFEKITFKSKYVKAVVTYDPMVRDHIRREYPWLNVFFIPFGYDKKILLPPSEEEIRKIKALVKGKRMVLYAGSMDEIIHKVSIILDAAKIVIERIPDVVFVMIGDAGDLPYKVEQKGLTSVFLFLGKLPKNEVWKWMHISDVCLQVTIEWCTGLKVSEYMACGKAMISVSGFYNMYKDFLLNDVNCKLVPLDHKKLAEAIIELLNDEDKRKKFGANAFETIRPYALEYVGLLHNNIRNSILKLYTNHSGRSK